MVETETPIEPTGSPEAIAEGPTEQAEGAFDWDRPEPSAGTTASASTVPLGSLAESATAAIVFLHHKIAQLTAWDGWEIAAQERAVWMSVLNPLLKSLDPKKWGLAFALIPLLLLEAGKVMRYLRFRGAFAGKTPPARETPTASQSPSAPVEATGTTPLGKPMEAAE